MDNLQQPQNKPFGHRNVIIFLLLVIIILATLTVWLYTQNLNCKQTSPSQQNLKKSNPLTTPSSTSQNTLPPPSSTSSQPKLLFSGNYGLKIWDDDQFYQLANYKDSKDEVSGVTVSPSGDKIVFGHYNYDRDGGATGIFSSGINTLALANLNQPYNSDDFGQKGQTAKWSFDWSPDGNIISYVINDGQALEIYDLKNNKVLQHLAGEATTPVAWLSQSRISFAQDHKLYLGTLQNPKQTVIADDVYNSLCAFEDPPMLIRPNWSKSERYVGYYTEDNYIIKDTQNGKIIKANVKKPADETGPCGDNIDIGVIGWDNQDNFYFATGQNNEIYQIAMPDGTQTKFQNLYAGQDSQLTQISSDSNYFGYSRSGGGRYGYTINNSGKEGSIVCRNEFGFTQGPVSSAKTSWSKKYPGVVVIRTDLPKGYVLTVFDVENCQVLNNIQIDAEYGNNGLYFAGVQ